MDETQLQNLATRIKYLLKEYEIEDEGFQLKVLVTKPYFDSIKNNFSERNPLDILVGARGEDWTIDLIYLAGTGE